MARQDDPRPLFTIFVLVSGVVGGLAVVISLVYLYRFCLKKRPPVTTTGKPEQKREQIRSELSSQSRPLALLIEDHPSKDHTVDTNLDRESAFGSPTKIAQVFPLISKEPPYIRRTIQEVVKPVQNVCLLSVSDQQPRAHSADLLGISEPVEVRRASCDVPRGTGRQLPSTEGLERQYAERQRRMSTLARSDAVQTVGPPRKQLSSPLPDHPRIIYTRGHAHSRSWNPECPSPPLQSERPNYNPPIQLEQPNYNYYQMNEIYPEGLYIPTINEPTVQSTLSNRTFRQAKSFDDRSAGTERRLSVDRRTMSMAETEGNDVETPVTAACHTLWEARGHLEKLHALGISDPSSASTSFDSNTDSQPTTVLAGERVLSSREDAERRRHNYKSLLVQRKFLSTAAVSSFDSSTESSAPDPPFASSMDSAPSDLEQRRLSLMSRYGPAISSPQITQRQQMTSFDGSRSSRRPLIERDYSVDTTSSNLFREWSRVDPAYEERDQRPARVLQRGYTHDYYGSPRTPTSFHHQMTIGSPAIIGYPDDHR